MKWSSFPSLTCPSARGINYPRALRAPRFADNLQPELLFHLGESFARDRQLGRSILQRDDRLAGEPGVDFLDRADVDERRPMDTQPLARIEPRLEIGDGEIERVVLRARCRERQLVLRVKVRHVGDVDEIDALAGP